MLKCLSKVLCSKTALAVGTVLTSSAVFAEDSVTLPETGINLAGYATAAITSLGAIVAVVIGGTIAFILIRAGVRWIRSMK